MTGSMSRKLDCNIRDKEQILVGNEHAIDG